MKKDFVVSILGLFLALFFIAVTATAEKKEPDLRSAIKQKDIEAVRSIVSNLVAQNDKSAFDELSKSLSSFDHATEPEIYHFILLGMAGFTDSGVLSEVAAFILNERNKEACRDLLFRVKSNRSPGVIELLSKVMTKGTRDMQMECIYQLGNIYSKESLQALIGFLKTVDFSDKPLVRRCIEALESITGLKDRNYPEWWVQWWEENKDKDSAKLVNPKVASDYVGNVSDYRDMKEVEKLEKERIIVVKQAPCKEKGNDGNYDHIENILEQLGIPHTVITKDDFEQASYKLDDKWALVFNCTLFKVHCDCPNCKISGEKGDNRLYTCSGCDVHIQHETKLSEKAIRKIVAFVESGGYLFTEDLGIEEILERGFKGFITHSKVLPARTVKIVPAQGAGLHPYLKYVFESPPESNAVPSWMQPQDKSSSGTISVKPSEFHSEAEWLIDDKSPDIKILNKDAVTVLITSPELAKENKNEGAVAVTFGASDKKFTRTGTSREPSYLNPGGRVLHVMSHFGRQRSQRDEFALQNLLVNFFEELNERRPKQQPGKKK